MNDKIARILIEADEKKHINLKTKLELLEKEAKENTDFLEEKIWEALSSKWALELPSPYSLFETDSYEINAHDVEKQSSFSLSEALYLICEYNNKHEDNKMSFVEIDNGTMTLVAFKDQLIDTLRNDGLEVEVEPSQSCYNIHVKVYSEDFLNIVDNARKLIKK